MTTDIHRCLDGAHLVAVAGPFAAVWHGGYTLNFYAVTRSEWNAMSAKEYAGESPPERPEVSDDAENWLRERVPARIPDDHLPLGCENCGHVGAEGGDGDPIVCPECDATADVEYTPDGPSPDGWFRVS